MSTTQPEKNPDYRFLHIKNYTSAEWLADRKKKYRKVLDVQEVNYLYAEVAFHNKHFDEAEWQIHFRLSCHMIGYDGQYLHELFSQEQTVTVDPNDSIVYIRDGWGSPEYGGYWLHGTYVWVARLNDQVVGTCQFHIQNVGLVTATHNPYFEPHALRMFESGPDRLPLSQRRYTDQFVSKETRYIWGEFTFKNLLRDRDWVCELTYLFFNDARQLKAEVSEIVTVVRDDEFFCSCSGWGNVATGTWFEDNFTLEIVFMGQLVGVHNFSVVGTKDESKPTSNWISKLKMKNWLMGKK